MGCLFGLLLLVLGWWIWKKSEELDIDTPETLNLLGKDEIATTKRGSGSGGVKVEEVDNDVISNAHPHLQKVYHIVMERKGYLIHVTEAANLNDIFKHGAIFSVNMLRKMDIKPIFMSTDVSRSLDRRNYTEDYVKLAFDESYPMFNAAIYHGRLKEPAIILVHPRIILEKDVKISPRNSASNDYFAMSNLSEEEKAKLLQWDVIYKPVRSWDEYWSIINTKQAEILVKDSVPVSYFLKIAVPYSAQINQGILKRLPISRSNTRSLLRYNFAKNEEGWW